MKVSAFRMAPQLALVLPSQRAMVLACIEAAVAEYIGTMNGMPHDVHAAIRAGSRRGMTDGAGAIVAGWSFTCTRAQAMTIRVELCAAAVAVRETDPELSDQLLKAERAIARAMRAR